MKIKLLYVNKSNFNDKDLKALEYKINNTLGSLKTPYIKDVRIEEFSKFYLAYIITQ